MISNNPPSKHHYIPSFYLQQWAGADRRVCEYKRVPGRIVHRQAFPTETGWERDLYRLEGASVELAQTFEQTFMHMIDTEAALVLQRIITGDPTPWPGEIRSAWVRFVLGLRFRNPQAVKLIKAHLLEVWGAGVAALKENYSRIMHPGLPPSFEEYMSRTERSAPYKAALILLQQIIDNPRVAPTIFDMHWGRGPLTRSKRTLLTSDRRWTGPLVWGSLKVI